MSLGKKVFHGMAWSAIERISIQSIQFVLGVILARILSPDEYGTFAILLVFISFSKIFIDSGFTKALIQKKERTQTDISTVFFFNVIISVICYILIWITAPYISHFYNTESLTLLLRVIAISLVINALFTVSATIFTINLDFKSITKINFISTLVSGVVAIYMAYIGFGVWALVYQTILKAVLTAILMQIILRWKPMLVFSKASLKTLFSFGSKLLLSSLLGSVFSNLNSILIGKYIGRSDLGFFSRGQQFSDFIFGIYSSALNSVLLPSLAPIQDERTKLIRHTRTIIKTSALLTAPIFMGLAVMAEPIIRILLTDKWIIAAPIMQLFCYARLITITSGVNINLLHVVGRTDLTLKQEYVKIVVRVVLIIVALPYGIWYIALAELISTIIHFFINTYYPGKMMNYGGKQQIKDIFPVLLSGLAMVIGLYLIRFLFENEILQLCLAPIVASTIYYICIKLFNIKELEIIISNTKSFFKRTP